MTGIVFNDVNSNGVQDNGETGIANVTVVLGDQVLGAEVLDTEGLNAEGRSTNMTTITDANGVYTFNNVPSGQYTLSFQLPAGTTGATPASVTVNVGGNGPVTVPPAVAQVSWIFYLPFIHGSESLQVWHPEESIAYMWLVSLNR